MTGQLPPGQLPEGNYLVGQLPLYQLPTRTTTRVVLRVVDLEVVVPGALVLEPLTWLWIQCQPLSQMRLPRHVFIYFRNSGEVCIFMNILCHEVFFKFYLPLNVEIIMTRGEHISFYLPLDGYLIIICRTDPRLEYGYH